MKVTCSQLVANLLTYVMEGADGAILSFGYHISVRAQAPCEEVSRCSHLTRVTHHLKGSTKVGSKNSRSAISQVSRRCLTMQVTTLWEQSHTLLPPRVVCQWRFRDQRGHQQSSILASAIWNSWKTVLASIAELPLKVTLVNAPVERS